MNISAIQKPNPIQNHHQNVSKTCRLQHSGHLKGGVHDRPFKQYLTRALSAKPFKQHLMEIVPTIGFQALRQNLCDETVSYCTKGPVKVWLYLFLHVANCCFSTLRQNPLLWRETRSARGITIQSKQLYTLSENVFLFAHITALRFQMHLNVLVWMCQCWIFKLLKFKPAYE